MKGESAMKMTKKILILIITALFFIGWSNKPGTNSPVCTAGSEQKRPQLIPDGNGGAVIVWEDSRSGSDYDIYGQYMDVSGKALWALDGTAICSAIGPQRYPQVTADGSGGFIAVWYDRRNGKHYDIYAQRIDSTGKVKWTTDGVAICTAEGYQYDAMIVSDGQGGAILAWQDRRNGANYDIYAQRIDISGKVQWSPNGIGICTAKEDQEIPQLVSDSSGGAIITWQDRRNGKHYDIYAQRINPKGIAQWTAEGMALCTMELDQRGPQLISDDKGFSVLTWMDKRNGKDYDIYAQRIDISGTIQWTANGVAICSEANGQYDPRLSTDGSSGAFITWQDYRKGSDCNFDAFAQQTDHKPELCEIKQLNEWNIYTQHINSSGKIQLAENGIAICNSNLDQYKPQVIPDGLGGTIIVWRSSDKENDQNIYAQHLDSKGKVKWPSKGAAITTAPGNQFDPLVVPDGFGGAIVTWYDNRNGNTSDIYAQKICASGKIGVCPPASAMIGTNRGGKRP